MAYLDFSKFTPPRPMTEVTKESLSCSPFLSVYLRIYLCEAHRGWMHYNSSQWLNTFWYSGLWHRCASPRSARIRANYGITSMCQRLQVQQLVLPCVCTKVHVRVLPRTCMYMKSWDESFTFTTESCIMNYIYASSGTRFYVPPRMPRKLRNLPIRFSVLESEGSQDLKLILWEYFIAPNLFYLFVILTKRRFVENDPRMQIGSVGPSKNLVN